MNGEGANTDANAQRPASPAPAAVTLPPAVNTADIQHTALPESNTTDVQHAALPESDTPANHPSLDSHPNDSHPASPNKVSTGITSIAQDQDIPNRDAPNHPDSQVPRGDTDLATSNNLPMNARESEWMRSKKTLNYFREVYKMGKLSDLISHWYQLEEALGFPETVSRLTT